MTLLLLAAWLSPQSAEEAFKKIEDSVEKAKTVRVKFTLEGRAAKEGLGGDMKATGTLLLKEGNRLRLEIKVAAGGGEHEMTLVSDGARLRQTRDGKEASAKDAPKDLSAMVDAGLVRTGPFMAVMFGAAARASAPDPKDPKKFLQIRDLKDGPGDDRGKTLSFTVRIDGETDVCSVKVWYDPKTWALLRRELTILREGEAQGKITETYDEYALNGEIPDERFSSGSEPKKDEKK